MPRRTDRLLWALVLVALTCVAYVPAMQAGFIWDDDNYVTRNRTLRSPAGLWSIWTDPQTTPQYYPLVHSMFWIEYQMWGLRPAGYHVVNILLHAANAVLLWRLLQTLAVPAPWFAAAVFALHPVHVESVAWITERKNVLSGLFYLAAAWAYFRFAFPSDANVDKRVRSRFYCLSLLCFAAALLSKTVTVTLPAGLLLIVWWRRGRVAARDVGPLLPMFCVGIPFGLLTVWLERHHVGAIGADWQLSLADRCLIAGRAVWFYAMKLAWPTPLIFIYPRWRIDAEIWWQSLFPLSAIALVAILARRGKLTGPLVAVLLFVGTLFPALGFFDIFPMRYSFVADHFQYLASIALLVLAVAGGHSLSRRLDVERHPLTIGAAALVLSILLGLTWQQAGIYRDRETLWRDTLHKNPTCPMAHHNLGIVLREQGRLVEAGQEFRTVLQMDDRDNLARLNLANVRYEQGRFAEALEQYEQILKSEPRNLSARFNMANALGALQRVDEAEIQFRQVLEMDPQHPSARLNLAVLLMQQKRWEEARLQLLALLQIDPENDMAHFNLASVYLREGNQQLALFHAREVLRLAPDSPDAQELLRQVIHHEPE